MSRSSCSSSRNAKPRDSMKVRSEGAPSGYRNPHSDAELGAAMVGEHILGRFRIEGRIGSGGFGTVYRAWDERLERPVAVKVVEGERGAPRVTREAQAVARL